LDIRQGRAGNVGEEDRFDDANGSPVPPSGHRHPSTVVANRAKYGIEAAANSGLFSDIHPRQDDPNLLDVAGNTAHCLSVCLDSSGLTLRSFHRNRHENLIPQTGRTRIQSHKVLSGLFPNKSDDLLLRVHHGFTA
jgi:hypothetical protein